MDIGIFSAHRELDSLVSAAREVAEAGFGSMWTPQIFELDALTAIAVAAREVKGLEFGTCVVPTYRQHPMMMAQQALTVSQASGGRLSLGIGLSHQVVVEGMWGLSYDKPLRHMTEFLDVLMPLLKGDAANAEGETITGRGELGIPAEEPSVVLAALGPKMLELAGTVADGTTTWMVGPATIASHTSPSIQAAAEAAGREPARVVVALPTVVTDDPAGARERAAKEFEIYGHLPSYRAMLDREGAAGPEDVAVIGSADEVAERVSAIFDAGASTFVAAEFGSSDDVLRTREALAALL